MSKKLINVRKSQKNNPNINSIKSRKKSKKVEKKVGKSRKSHKNNLKINSIKKFKKSKKIFKIQIPNKNDVFYAHHIQLVQKYFFYSTALWQFFFINKKVAQWALLYTKKNYSPKIEI
jgi:hypothetical protein